MTETQIAEVEELAFNLSLLTSGAQVVVAQDEPAADDDADKDDDDEDEDAAEPAV